MTRPLVELVEQFCQYQLKQRGKTEGGVQTYRWNLDQFLVFGRARFGRVARVSDLTKALIQDWMAEMAARDLTLGTIRSRQSTLSSLCSWLVKREVLPANPIAGMDRPPHRIEPPKQVPTPALMDALIEAARKRQRPRDVAIAPLTISWTRLLPYSPRPVGRIVRRSSLLRQRCASFFEGHFTRSPHSSTIDLVMRPPA